MFLAQSATFFLQGSRVSKVSQLNVSIIHLASGVLASCIPVLVLFHEDFVFARLHLGVVLDGATRLDEELVDAPAEFQNCVNNRLCSNPPQLKTPYVMRERTRHVPVHYQGDPFCHRKSTFPR